MTQFQLPQGFVVGDAFQSLNTSAQDDNLADGIGQGYGVIGYKGKAWTLRYRGQVKQFVRPDDGTPASYIDVIILGSPPKKSKSYYPAYVPGQSDGERPICSSMDGEVPDVGVTTKQSEVCATCTRNEWKTNPQTGRKSRECTDYKRLAVLIMPTISKALLGETLLEAVFLRVPPDSLQALGSMGDNMAKQGLHYSSYVTRISFDPTKAHPSMVFTPVQGLSNAEAPVVLTIRQDPLVERIMHGDAAVIGKGSNVVRLSPSGYEPTGLLEAVANKGQGQAVPPPNPRGVDTSYVDLAADKQVAQIVRTSTIKEAKAEVLQAQPTPAVDVGSAELSDTALDAKIAAMIKNGKK